MHDHVAAAHKLLELLLLQEIRCRNLHIDAMFANEIEKVASITCRPDHRYNPVSAHAKQSHYMQSDQSGGSGYEYPVLLVVWAFAALLQRVRPRIPISLKSNTSAANLP